MIPAYLREVAALLAEQEPGLWQWFGSAELGKERAEQARLELLKSTYRLARESHPQAYTAADAAQKALGLDVPVTIYQAPDQGVMNASTWFVPGEVLVVLHGAVLDALPAPELLALFGHELAHHHLYVIEDGRYLTAATLLEHVASDPRAPAAFAETTRRFRRFAEIYSDRGALKACGDFSAAVACLVKVSTGLKQVDPAAYVRQAEEVLAKGELSSGEHTHPESFIRAHALQAWDIAAADETDRLLRRIVTGEPRIDALDLLEQRAVTAQTREVIGELLKEPWFETTANVAHARRYFPELEKVAPLPPVDAPSIKEYLCYVLLDFAVADKELEDAALAHVIRVAEGRGLLEPFQRVVTKELKLSAKAFTELRERAAGVLAKAREQSAAEVTS